MGNILLNDNEKDAKVAIDPKKVVGTISLYFHLDGTCRFTQEGTILHDKAVNLCEIVKAFYVTPQLNQIAAQMMKNMQKRVTLPDGSLPPR